MLIVGLTGGIATGKSTATAVLRREGVAVVDLDELARVVVEPGRPAHSRIVRRFGRSVLLADGQLDRAALGKLVFADVKARRELNAATHGAILRELLGRIAALWLSGAPVCVIDAPLLFEARMHHLCRTVVVMRASAEVQLARLMSRDGLERDDALQRVQAQMPLADKCSRADVVIDNDGEREGSERQLQAAWRALLAQHGAGSTRAGWPGWARLPRARTLAISAALWGALLFARAAGWGR